jgi:hypothetical protein
LSFVVRPLFLNRVDLLGMGEAGHWGSPAPCQNSHYLLDFTESRAHTGRWCPGFTVRNCRVRRDSSMKRFLCGWEVLGPLSYRYHRWSCCQTQDICVTCLAGSEELVMPQVSPHEAKGCERCSRTGTRMFGWILQASRCRR